MRRDGCHSTSINPTSRPIAPLPCFAERSTFGGVLCRLRHGAVWSAVRVGWQCCQASIWAGSKVTAAAVALAVTSAAASAPTMTEATAGRSSSQASDTWYGCKPHSSLSRSTARPISNSRPVNPEPPNLLSPENSRSWTYMPANSPPCNGPNGTIDSSNCQAGPSSPSTARSIRLYLTCAQTGAAARWRHQRSTAPGRPATPGGWDRAT